MKPTASRIERMLEKIEATLVPPERKRLQAIIHEGDAEAVVKEKQEKALAEHVARHPEDVGRTVEDFKWILRAIVRPAALWAGKLRGSEVNAGQVLK
jgi:replicative superfamily II helicase